MALKNKSASLQAKTQKKVPTPFISHPKMPPPIKIMRPITMIHIIESISIITYTICLRLLLRIVLVRVWILILPNYFLYNMQLAHPYYIKD